MEEITPEEAANRLAQLPPGALPGLEANLRRIVHGLPPMSEESEDDLGKFYADALEAGWKNMQEPDLPDGWTYQSLPDTPEAIPLTIYLDDRKYIVGTATVIGRKVHAQIKPAEGRELEELVKRGIIESMSVHFSTRPPAQPQLPYGEISPGVMENFWKREEVSFMPTGPIRHIPLDEEGAELAREKLRELYKTKGLAYGHTIEDEEIDRINDALHGEPKMKGLKADYGIVDEAADLESEENVPKRHRPRIEGLDLAQEKLEQIREQPRIEGLKATHGVVDEVTHVDDDEFKDKFPYGKA